MTRPRPWQHGAPWRRSTIDDARTALVTRVTPLLLAGTLAGSAWGRASTDHFEAFYDATALVAAGVMLLSAIAARSLRIRLIAGALAGSVFIARITFWLITPPVDATWPQRIHSATSLATMTLLTVVWAWIADYITIRGPITPPRGDR